MRIASLARSNLATEMSPRSGAISTSLGPRLFICSSTVCLPRKAISWLTTASADVISSRFSGGRRDVDGDHHVAAELARLVDRQVVGDAAVDQQPAVDLAPARSRPARTCWRASPRRRCRGSARPLRRSRCRWPPPGYGTGSLSKSLMPVAGSATTRRNASIETPAMTPFGAQAVTCGRVPSSPRRQRSRDRRSTAGGRPGASDDGAHLVEEHCDERRAS